MLVISIFQMACSPFGSNDQLVATTNAPAIHIGIRDARNPADLLVWYVETDGAGHSGYACVYSTLGVPNPGGKGLFQSLEALRDAIHSDQHSGMLVETGFRGVVPSGWRIRKLIEPEMITLRDK